MINKQKWFLFGFLLSFIIGCSAEKGIIKEKTLHENNPDTNSFSIPVVVPKVIEGKKVLLGIDVLEKNGFNILANKRVGLITNQTGVNNKLKSTIDILFDSPNVNLVALFGPEHGIRGNFEGGNSVKSYKDKKTNLPVYSLYGKTRKPTKDMLNGLDVLVYDIQDIGVRSYTFISTMGMAIEAASENDVEFVLLDRPDPLGGIKIEGSVVESKFISFIGQYPIPYIYGLTCGELAKLLVGEKLVLTSKSFKLTVVPMKNWNRNMTWQKTGLNWVPTSPHIPHFFTPFFYPMTGILGELRSAISIGVGYTLPFQVVGAEWIEPDRLSDKLNNMNIPGLIFRPITYKPYYAFGKGKTLKGVQIYITDYDKVNLTNTQFFLLNALNDLYPGKDLFKLSTNREIGMFNKAIGTDKIYKIYKNNDSKNMVFNHLDKDIHQFQLTSKKYYLY